MIRYLVTILIGIAGLYLSQQIPRKLWELKTGLLVISGVLIAIGGGALLLKLISPILTFVALIFFGLVVVAVVRRLGPQRASVTRLSDHRPRRV